MLTRILLTASILAAFSIPARAQGFRAPGHGFPQPQGGQAIEIQGTIEAAAAGRILMTTSTNQKMYVFVQPGTTETHLVGTASPEFLRTGMVVEFTAEISKTGIAKEKVTQLTVLTPTQQTPLGLFPEGIGGIDLEQFGPLAGKPETGGRPSRRPSGKQPGGDFGGGPAHKPGAASAVQLPATCVVRGQVKGAHGTSLTVTAAKMLIKAELADNAEIKVDIADCSMAAKGDKISVKGKTFQAKNMIQAETVRVEAAQPLSGPKKRAVKPGTAKPDHAKPDHPAGKPAPAAKGDKELPLAEPAPKEKPGKPPVKDELDLPF